MKPILFNTEMVRAILAGRKTVTRRLVKPRYREGEAGFYVVTEKYTGDFRYIETYDEDESGTDRRINPPCFPGDILYVRETWGDYRECEEDGEGLYYLYRADYPDGATTYQYPDGMTCELPKWHPSIHMPKEAARIFLRVTDVRVERLQEITEVGARNEGAELIQSARGLWSYRKGFETIWNSTLKHMDHIRYGWTANPWVWVIEFERCEKPEEGES